MTQTKHQKLAKEMQLLAQKHRKKNISLKSEFSHIRHDSNRDVKANILARLKPLKTMVKTYHYSFFYFKPNSKDFELLGLMHRGGFLEIAERKQLENSSVKSIKIFVNWIALINYLEEDSRSSLATLQLDLWSLPFEANLIKSFKKESLQNSLFYQTQTIARYEKQKLFIKVEYAKKKNK